MKKLLFALWITPFLLGIVITALLPNPASTGGLLFGAFLAGEVLFIGGIAIAAAEMARLTWLERVKRSASGRLDWLREITQRYAASNAVLAGLLVNWFGALLYPVVLLPFGMSAFGERAGAVVVLVLVLDIVATFAVRVPLLVYVLRHRKDLALHDRNPDPHPSG